MGPATRTIPLWPRPLGRAGMGTTAAAFMIASSACSQPPSPAAEAGLVTGEVKPVLDVTDVEVAAPFYRDVLGFGFLGYSNSDGEPYYAEMTAGPLKFGLHEAMNPEQESRIGQQRLYFRVTDLGAQRSSVAEAGGEPGDVIDTDWMDLFIVHDRDGHEIVFAYTDAAEHSIDPG
jgi:predicted enzyme related to lactoylglutathione lyase